MNYSHIPVFKLSKKLPGKTILITAGMDGDEYTGIEAAYKLIEFYKQNNFPGKIIIIPIVNIEGFKNCTSFNPLDKKYPKYIFPGNDKGTETEQLMFWLYKKYIKECDIWIDLHSGSISEHLNPFIWTWVTKRKEIDNKVLAITQKIKAPITIFEQYQKNSKAEFLSKENICYILLESGELGKREKNDIERHIKWVQKIIQFSHAEKFQSTITKTLFKRVSYFVSQHDGVWYPNTIQLHIKKNDRVGVLKDLNGKIIKEIIMKNDCIHLWSKKLMSCKKGDEIIAVGFRK